MTDPTPRTDDAYGAAVGAWRSGADLDTIADGLVAQMTGAEKLSMLDADLDFWEGRIRALTLGPNTRPVPAARCERLGVPGFAFVDGPRGMTISPGTCFPVSMARGASFDTDLERRIGQAIGLEVAARGGDLFGGVCVNLLRHPAWGRAQETYGEDPHHVGELGAALALGAQDHVMACVKHFACNSMETSRHRVDVIAGDRALHEVYLPHFRRITDAGVATVMAAYNSLNGEWCCQSTQLIDSVLRQEWGWDGVVITDFIFGIRDAVASVKAGVDIEMPYGMVRMQQLPAALADGLVSWDEIDRIAARIVRTLIRFDHLRTPPPPATVIAGPEHVALALESARRSIVLLENDGVLPLGAPTPASPGLGTLAVLGELARVPNLGDGGSSDVRPPYAITPAAGLRAALPGHTILTGDDPAIAADADVAIVVVGTTMHDEGEFLDLDAQLPLLERHAPPFADDDQRARFQYLVDHQEEAVAEPPGGDRATLRLSPAHERLILETAAVNPRTVVVLMGGSAFVTEPWRDRVAAIVMAWYPGMEGGTALAEVLLGRCQPSGHLPFAVPVEESSLPPFEIHTDRIEYGLLHGQWLLEATGAAVRYPFGHGLSYTTFEPVSVEVLATETGPVAEVGWRNTGDRDGADVVLLYASLPDSVVERPRRRLVGFARIELPAGSTTTVAVPLDVGQLRHRHDRAWAWEGGRCVVEAARWSGDPNAARWTGVMGSGPLAGCVNR